MDVDPAPYLNRTNLTLYIDTNIIGSTSEAVRTLVRLREEGWISLQRTDTMDTEFIKAPPEKRSELTDESSRYPEAYGPLVLDHSRLGSAVLGDEDDEARLRRVFSILHPGGHWDSARENDVRDAMHVSTAIRYGGYGFVTHDRLMLNKHDQMAEGFANFRIWRPEKAVEEALGRVRNMRELHRREPERGPLPEWFCR
ncbi:MAG: hypothetical protein JWQ95_459 [Sphaerisporangium sp.]|jgi:hypothetical protein|nr:hypothetical protein [Sphaerisporangium sp.]